MIPPVSSSIRHAMTFNQRARVIQRANQLTQQPYQLTYQPYRPRDTVVAEDDFGLHKIVRVLGADGHAEAHERRARKLDAHDRAALHRGRGVEVGQRQIVTCVLRDRLVLACCDAARSTRVPWLVDDDSLRYFVPSCLLQGLRCSKL